MSVYMLLFLQNQSSDHHFTQNPFMIVYLIKDMFDVFPSDHVAWVWGYEESQKELLVLRFAYVYGETNLLKLFQTRAMSVGFTGFKQTTPYVQQQQHVGMLKELNNFSWNTQAIAVSVLTSVHLVSSNKLYLIFSTTPKKHCSDVAIPQPTTATTDNAVANKWVTECTTVTKWHGRR